MSILSRIFGSKSKSANVIHAIDYKGYAITPNPQKEAGGFRIGALITKTVDGVDKSHQLIRADIVGAKDAADDASIAKAKVMIDQSGEAIFR